VAAFAVYASGVHAAAQHKAPLGEASSAVTTAKSQTIGSPSHPEQIHGGTHKRRQLQPFLDEIGRLFGGQESDQADGAKSQLPP
jgi:hypothetical protein